MKEKPLITVSIKTLNEEQGIERTIESVRAQLSDYPHQIIVADSLSTDNTRALALASGATVVCLDDIKDRCCGVGHQLSWFYSDGDYLLLLDGDMELEAGFIDAAIAFLEAHPDYAGVAGQVEMDEACNYEFKSRKQRLHMIYPVGDVDHLAGGGLYRRSAIESIGYLTNLNLHALEESELGMRVLAAGHKLHRLPIPYFKHTSYTMTTFSMLRHRWKSGYLAGPGELLRNSWGKPYFPSALRSIRNEVIFTLYLWVLVCSLLTLNKTLIAVMLLPLIAFIALKSIKNRSLKTAIHSVINLSFFSAGLVRGLLHRVKDPTVSPKVTVTYPNHSNES